MFNSIVSTGIVVVAGIFISVAAAYVLSKKRFHGRSLIFKLNTLSMMFVPTAVSIPRYLVIKQVGLLDTFWANVVPMLAMPVGIFLVKQFVDQLPEELVESARIDGADGLRHFIQNRRSSGKALAGHGGDSAVSECLEQHGGLQPVY